MSNRVATMLSTVFLLSMMLTACENDRQVPMNQEADPAKKEEVSTFRLNIKTDPTNLNPGQAADQTSFAVLNSVMEGLTRIGPDGTPQNAAATDIKISDDKKTYTFSLRDMKWTNGDPVTAQDFEYAWKWVLNPKNECQYAYQLYPVLNAEKTKNGDIPLDQVGVKAIDNKTLQVTLSNPTPYFLELTAFPTFFPVNRKISEQNASWYEDAASFVGDGPFKLTKWDHKAQIQLQKNTDYWDAKTVKLNRIEMSIIEDINTELRKFKDGELDWAGAPLSEIPTEAIPDLKKSGKLTTLPVSGTYIYKFKTKNPPFNNVKIRKALSFAIDRKMLVEQVLHGTQMPAMAYVPPTMMKENEKGYFPDADFDEAKQLLKEGMRELGLEKLPSIEIAYNTGTYHEKIAQAIQNMWKTHLGINVTLKNTDWNTHLQDITNGNYQIARTFWLGDYNDPINFLEIYTIPQGNNNTFWTNDVYNQLIKQSYNETDPTKRLQMLKDAEKILMEEMPFIPIYFYTLSYLKADKVSGVFIDSLGNADFKWAHLD